jgi:hypothetical protein
VSGFISKIVSWVTAGYPDGVPGADRVPLFALLSRRLSNDEITAVVQELIDRRHIDDVDIGSLITQLTDGLPTPEDIERVREHLATHGWPLDDPRESDEREGLE